MKVDFPTKEQELLVRLKLIQNSIQRVLHQVDKGTLEIPEIKAVYLTIYYFVVFLLRYIKQEK